VTAGTAPGGGAEQGRRALDEALKLLDALQAQPASAESPRDGAHLSGECRVCPVCRGLAALREMNPDAVARAGRALGDLVGAMGEFLGDLAGGESAGDPTGAPGPPPSHPPAASPPVRVQRIDVSD
jgi:hypothetical protein